MSACLIQRGDRSICINSQLDSVAQSLIPIHCVGHSYPSPLVSNIAFSSCNAPQGWAPSGVKSRVCVSRDAANYTIGVKPPTISWQITMLSQFMTGTKESKDIRQLFTSPLKVYWEAFWFLLCRQWHMCIGTRLMNIIMSFKVHALTKRSWQDRCLPSMYVYLL